MSYSQKIQIEKPTKLSGAMPTLANLILKASGAGDFADKGICVSCGAEVKTFKTKSHEFGEIAVLPEQCNACKEKDYQEHLKLEKVEAFLAQKSRCGGLQNVPVKHADHFPMLKNLQENNWQRSFIHYLKDVLNGGTVSALIQGGNGQGKTYLAKIITNELIERLRHVCFIKATDLAIFIKKLTYKDDYRQIMKDFREVDVLIIDDFGSHKATDVVKEMVFSIIESRYENRKTTIVTTNLQLEDLKKLDERLASRLMDKNWISRFQFSGYDLRRESEELPF